MSSSNEALLEVLRGSEAKRACELPNVHRRSSTERRLCSDARLLDIVSAVINTEVVCGEAGRDTQYYPRLSSLPW